MRRFGYPWPGCRGRVPAAGVRGEGDGPGAVPGEAPHRHQELRAGPDAAPGLLKLQQTK